MQTHEHKGNFKEWCLAYKKSGDHQRDDASNRPKRAKPSALSPLSRMLVCRYMRNAFER
jgi:hypothetical protein